MSVKNRSKRLGLSLLEVLVVISIVGLLISLILPALQHARESARRTNCANNLKQMGAAMLQFEQAKGRLPSAGEGTDFTASPPATVFEMRSALSQMMTYLDESFLGSAYNPLYAYNDAAFAANQTAAHAAVTTFLCATNPNPLKDPNGYGQTDYMPISYTDIDPQVGVKNPLSRRNGAFVLGGLQLAKIIDGTSRTLAVIEDSGRNWEGYTPGVKSPFPDPIFSGGSANVWDGTKQVTYTQWCQAHSITSQGLPSGDTATPSGNRAMNRWAEPASTGGISGQANSMPGNLLNPINGNDTLNGPPTCPWSQTNCGPNEEAFSWHPQGVNALLCDGRVQFIGAAIDPRVLRFMITSDEQVPYDDSTVP